MFKVLLCVTSQHDWRLVGLAAAVCVASTLATFFLYSKAPPSPQWRRWTWLAMTGAVAGAGIWTTHFVGMLAFKTGLPTGYAPIETLGSLVVAMLSVTAGFALASSKGGRRGSTPIAIAGGAIVGLGIALMHYVGMSGYRTAGTLQWDWTYVGASLATGAVLGGVALSVGRPGADWRRRNVAALVLTLAIVAMHFTGMTAVTITPDASVVVAPSLLSDAMMVTISVAVTALILVTAIGGVAFDTASRNGNLRRLREALDVMPEGLAFYDSADRLVAWNNQYEDLCRDSGATLEVGMPFAELLQSDIVHGAYPEAAGREKEWVAERKAARRGEIPSLTQMTASGRWLRITDRRTADGGTVSVSVDITDLKRAELAMAKAQAEAEAAAAVKAEFLANMSHELRTPLTSILGFTALAAKQADMTVLTRTYVERVSEASRALLCIVNDVLDFSKLEAGQVAIQPEPVSLDKLCQGTLDLFTPQAGAKDLSLIHDADRGDEVLVLALDPDRLRQILLNLVGNAMKFTATGGVTLQTRYDRAAGMLRVAVIDTGAGISPEKLEMLFKRFSQVDGSLTRAQGGTGLGLAICKGLVEAMGGEIGAETEEGRGSRFWFEIPAPPAVLEDRPEEAAVESSVHGVRVLVADDHATNRQLAGLFLAGIGAEITEAVDGQDAVAQASQQAFDVILMDVHMPRLGGPGALQAIRGAAGPNRATPILAFTADADADARTAGDLQSMGFQDVVAKPINPAALIAAISRAAGPGEDVARSLAEAG